MLPLVAMVMAGGCWADPPAQPTHSQEASFFWASADQCLENYSWADLHVEYIRSLRAYAGAPRWIDQWEAEAMWRRDCWYWLYTAKATSEEDWALPCLRHAIGHASYYQGVMPNPVPRDWFPRP